jgi:hypothetical protein
MQHPKNAYLISLLVYRVECNVRRLSDDQFSGARDPAGAA